MEIISEYELLQLIAFLGLLLGVFARTYFPYKSKEAHEKNLGREINFDIKYIMTALVAMVITAIIAYTTFTIPEGTLFTVFIQAFIFAYGINAIANKIAK